MTTVQLSWFEVFQGAMAGVMRRIEAQKLERPEPYCSPKSDPWGVDIEAACAELAVAKFVGVYWESVVRQPKNLPGDVGRIQVRSTTLPDGCLILHKRDRDDATFVLVVGRIPKYRVAGYIQASACKQERFWSQGDGRAAYFVPQSALTAPDKALYDLCTAFEIQVQQ